MIAAQDEWRKDLGFSDRLTAKTEITAAYRLAHPKCSANEANKHGKDQEETARKQALSISEYHQLCARAIQLLKAAVEPAKPVVDQHPDEHIFPNLPEHGATIGNYTNAHHHADGLFSEVFRARCPSTPNDMVALKITTPSMMKPPHDSEREARILKALAGGNNIIELQEIFQQAGGRLVLVFPFMPHDLATLLVRTALTPALRRSVLRDLFSALAFVHAQNIVHRDVKPSNILLASPTGPAYLADFGIAWSASDRASEPPQNKILDVGTTCYRPPELLFGYAEYGASLDLWAAGCVAAQVVTFGRETLFDAGDLGSELALIKSIFETLGTPDVTSWPEAAKLPDWGKMNFAEYPGRSWEQILPKADADGRDLVSRLVVYESGSRIQARQALDHPYLVT